MPNVHSSLQHPLTHPPSHPPPREPGDWKRAWHMTRTVGGMNLPRCHSSGSFWWCRVGGDLSSGMHLAHRPSANMFKHVKLRSAASEAIKNTAMSRRSAAPGPRWLGDDHRNVPEAMLREAFPMFRDVVVSSRSVRQSRLHESPLPVFLQHTAAAYLLALVA